MSESVNRAVFLSYASQDAEAARRVREALRRVGTEVWFDQNELVGGDAWDAKIRKQIRECALFVAVISAATQARREGYFRLEWKLAAQRTHMMAEGTPFVMPVVIDGTRDNDAIVPSEFRDVQWTRLPGGETSAAFAQRVKRLCENPESEPLPATGSTVYSESGRAPSRGQSRPPATPPFLFSNRSYTSGAQLAAGLVQNWPEATRRWADGSIVDWVKQNSADENLNTVLGEIAAAKNLDAGQRLAVGLLALNASLPLIWEGEVITDAWLSGRPACAAKLCSSGVPEWLKKIRGETWLHDCAVRRASILATMPATNLVVNRALVEQLVFGPAKIVEGQVAALVEEFAGAKNPGIDALFKRDELSFGEAVLLLALPRETFLRPDQVDAPCAAELSRFEGHTGPVYGVAFGAAGRCIVSGGHDAQMVAWDPNTGGLLRPMTGVTADVHSVVFSPDGGVLASGGADGVVRIWDVNLGRELRRMASPLGLLSSLAFSPSGRQLASAGSAHFFILWNVRSAVEIRRMCGHDDWIAGLAFSPDGRRIASGSADHSIRMWEVETATEVFRLDARCPVHGVAFTPDGRGIASCGAGHEIRLWDADSGKEVRQFAGHTGSIHALAFNPTRPWLASAGADHTVRIWHVRTGVELQRLDAHSDIVRCLAFSHDGRLLASGGSDHAVRIWQMMTMEP